MKIDTNSVTVDYLFQEFNLGKLICCIQNDSLYVLTHSYGLSNKVAFLGIAATEDYPDCEYKKEMKDVILSALEDNDDIYVFDTLEDFCKTALFKGWTF